MIRVAAKSRRGSTTVASVLVLKRIIDSAHIVACVGLCRNFETAPAPIRKLPLLAMQTAIRSGFAAEGFCGQHSQQDLASKASVEIFDGG